MRVENHAVAISPQAIAIAGAEPPSKSTRRQLWASGTSSINPFHRTRPLRRPNRSDSAIVRARLYLDGLAGEWGLRAFRGITRSPILEDDGGMRAEHGFDVSSGLWCYKIPNVAVPERPTKEDATTALNRLRHFFRTFPFADGQKAIENNVEVAELSEKPGLDESIFLTALLTAVARQSLPLAPAFLCNAPAYSGAGTGKGLLAKALAIIGSGVRPAAFTSGHDAAEFDKRLTAALTEARPAIFLDNFNAKDLRSDILASALTEDPMMVRIMGHTKNVPLHTRTFVAITGNGIQVAEDMARRTLKTDLDARMENPEQRKFSPGFLQSAHDNRGQLLSDALTIWRWGRQNSIDAGLPLGNYEVWAQWCRDPLLALGCCDPVERIAAMKAADPRRAKLRAVFDQWSIVHQDNKIKGTELADSVLELIDEQSTRKAAGSFKYNRQRVASFLVRHAGTCVAGYTLLQVPEELNGKTVFYYRLK
jgi:putative DNA primase/helicase